MLQVPSGKSSVEGEAKYKEKNTANEVDNT